MDWPKSSFCPPWASLSPDRRLGWLAGQKERIFWGPRSDPGDLAFVFDFGISYLFSDV